jgi:glycerophosphoryl diester phosphodiesterase
MRRFLLFLAIALGVLFLIILLLRFWPGTRPTIEEPFEIIAHRGVHQSFPLTNLTDETCTAQIIDPPTHEYMENTIASMRAAFDAGATMVEFDVHHTSDGHMVVFHDWGLECRTNGKGVTQEQSLAYLKTLDIGYGYTADGGKTFPLRGKGVGLMPTLEEVLNTFPDKKFILHQKSGEVHTTEILAGILQKYPVEQQRRLLYWGTRYQTLKKLVPEFGGYLYDRGDMKKCGVAYAKSLGLGGLPEVCTLGNLILPAWSVKYLWGWPDRFMSKVVDSKERFFIAEVDTTALAEAFADLPIHGIMTNHIESVGPWFTQRKK